MRLRELSSSARLVVRACRLAFREFPASATYSRTLFVEWLVEFADQERVPLRELAEFNGTEEADEHVSKAARKMIG